MARFDDVVARFARMADERLTGIWHESLRGLDHEMKEATPVVTGNLQNSRAVSTAGPVAVDWRTKKFRDPDDSINGVIAGAEVGGVVHLGYRAPYAHKIEAQRAFVRLVAQRWPQIVADAVARAKGSG